ncbi:hypothetical protein CH063_02751, partial [Colletotrichum higginsianum]
PSRVACKDCLRWTATTHAESGRLPTLITCKSGSPRPRRGDVLSQRWMGFRVKGAIFFPYHNRSSLPVALGSDLTDALNPFPLPFFLFQLSGSTRGGSPYFR